MKIMQINVEFGYKLPTLLEMVSKEQPDILCAQEVQNTKEPIPLADNFQTLDNIKGQGNFEYSFFSPTWGAELFGPRIEVGNAIFSKLPLLNQQTVFISGQYTQSQTAQNWILNNRNLQICLVEINDQKLYVANHQGFLIKNSATGGEETSKFTQKLSDNLAPYKDSLIFCTDLNIIRESVGFAPIAELGLRDLTAEHNVKTTLSPVHRAPNKDSVACDYIFCSNDVKIENFRVSDEVVSDHKALILEFDI